MFPSLVHCKEIFFLKVFMETLNKELSVLQQTACNVNILGQNERKKKTFDHLDWWSGHAWFIKWFYRVGIMFVEWRTIAVFISNLFHIPFFPFDLILYVVLSVRNVKSSTVVKYDRFNKTCFIDGRWKYLVFFPPVLTVISCSWRNALI